MFFQKELGRARTPGTSVGWTSSLLGGRRSASGQMVTDMTALALPMVQICVSSLAETVAQLPVDIYRRLPDGGREVARDHPLYTILRHAPNPWQTPFEYREQGQMALGLRGNAYSVMEREPGGELKALYPVSPDKVTVLKGPDLMPYYRIGGADPVGRSQIHHVRWFSLGDGYVGASPIMLHANAIGYTQAIHEYASKSFVHGAALSGVLERPREAVAIKEQADIDRLTDDWVDKYGGASNAGKVALLQEGMTFRPLTVSNVDADLIAALKMTDLTVARIYKMPLPMTGSMEGATYNNVENLQIQFVIYTCMPWLRRHEQAMQRDFLGEKERDAYFIEFNIGGLLRGNITARYAAYAVGRQWGWLSINDIRRMENMPPVPGGDVYLQPLNMIDATKPLAMPPPETQPTQAHLDEIAKALA